VRRRPAAGTGAGAGAGPAPWWACRPRQPKPNHTPLGRIAQAGRNSPEEAAMRLAALLIATGLLAACASQPFDPAADIPPDAVPTTRTEANGDVITEYRVAGQLRVVRVEPARGPAYYLYDRDGDGLPD